MIAHVVPAVRLSYTAHETYDYQVPEHLTGTVRSGSVVVIPFAGRTIGGLVMSTAATSSRSGLKEIVGMADGLQTLPDYVPALWKKCAGLFVTTLPRLVWTALPALPRRALLTTNTPFPPVGGKERQRLILVPTVAEAIRLAQIIPDAVVYHSGLSQGEKYRIACGTNAGLIQCVVGTKSAVFLPFAVLDEVKIMSAGSRMHCNEDADPRYDARIIARELALIAGARFSALDALLPLGLIDDTTPPLLPIPAVIHDLKDAARAARARVLITEPLREKLDECLSRGKRALLLLNRRGVSTALVCKDCGVPVVCPDCVLPLTVHQTECGCAICERRFPLPEHCQKCAGTNLVSIGAGSKALYTVLFKQYPESVSVHVDRDSQIANLDNYNLVVGTSALFTALSGHSKPFDLVVDALLGAGTGRAGIWSVEETARSLRTLGTLVAPGGALHIQTFDTASPSLVALSDPAAFIAHERAERLAFGYPPANTLVVLLGAGGQEQTLMSAGTVLSQQLKKQFSSASVSDPEWSRPKRFRGKFRLTFTVSFPRGEIYSNLVTLLPSGWVAEVKLL